MNLKSSLKQKCIRSIVAGALIVGLFPVSASAALPTFPTTGSCAMLATMPLPVGETFPMTGRGYNMLAVVNITSATTGTLDLNITKVNYATTGPTVNTPVQANAIPVTIASMGASGPTGAKTFTFTHPLGGSVTLNAIAVNGGSTILLQGQTDPFSGVCQF